MVRPERSCNRKRTAEVRMSPSPVEKRNAERPPRKRSPRSNAGADTLDSACKDLILNDAEKDEAIQEPLEPPSSENAVLSDAAKVKNNLRIFNMCYLQAVKEEAERCQNSQNKMQRPDLKALTKIQNMNAVLYPDKRIGSLPGINVGDHFFSRAEMKSLGLHHHWLAGIVYIGKTVGNSQYDLPLAVSIVMSGGYEDDVDNFEDVIYTGEGGNNLTGNRRQMQDQVMSRGNLALKNCIVSGTPVRVIRGHDSKHSYTKKVYTYDGLYKVVDYWAEKGISGFTVYKFRLKRSEGQPALTTEQVHFCNKKVPKCPSELRGLVGKDISNGLENVPVPASNVVDDPSVAPDGYRYTTKVEVSDGIEIPPPAAGCGCVGQCVDPQKCSCAKLNGNTFPYVDSHGGRLAVPLDVVYECGPHCGCGPSCLNRTTQRGLNYRLEVYKTSNKGWAVRSWDPIPAGAPVCEYYGKLVKSDGLDVKNDVYLFDLDCIQTMRGIDGRQRRWGDLSKFLDDQNGKASTDVDQAQQESGHAEFCLDGSECGAVARFINHSCEPNLFIQCVLSSHHDMRIPRIVLFAADNISPLQELSYDYGYPLNSVVGPDGEVKQMPCYCGAISCRKRLY